MSDEREDTTIYKVGINHEEQHSIWPAAREIPLGWNDAGKSGTKQECLDYIKEVWTDMRPLSTGDSCYVRSFQLCHVNPQLGHLAGFRPAKSASNPTGKKQMDTTIAQVGKLP